MEYPRKDSEKTVPLAGINKDRLTYISERIDEFNKEMEELNEDECIGIPVLIFMDNLDGTIREVTDLSEIL